MTASVALLVWSLVAAVPAVTTVVRATARPSAPPARGGGPTRVLVVRPCAGAEPHLDDTLSSLPHVADGTVLHVVFAIADVNDAASPSIERAIRSLEARGVDARLVVSGAIGPNRKVQQISRSLAEAAPEPMAGAGEAFDVLVVADSDVDLDGTSLVEALARLDDPEVGVVWCPPVERGEVVRLGDLASRAVLGRSLHAFPLLSHLDRESMVGKLFGIRISTLRSLRGLDGLDDFLGEDVELARRVRGAGLSIVAVETQARSLMSGRTFRGAVARYARWMSVIRAQRPHLLVGYPLFFFHTMLIVVLALALGTNIAMVAAVVALATRLLVAAVAGRLSGLAPGVFSTVRDALIGDAVLVLALVSALRSRDVVWRERTLRILPGGRLVSVG